MMKVLLAMTGFQKPDRNPESGGESLQTFRDKLELQNTLWGSKYTLLHTKFFGTILRYAQIYKQKAIYDARLFVADYLEIDRPPIEPIDPSDLHQASFDFMNRWMFYWTTGATQDCDVSFQNRLKPLKEALNSPFFFPFLSRDDARMLLLYEQNNLEKRTLAVWGPHYDNKKLFCIHLVDPGGKIHLYECEDSLDDEKSYLSLCLKPNKAGFPDGPWIPLAGLAMMKNHRIDLSQRLREWDKGTHSSDFRRMILALNEAMNSKTALFQCPTAGTVDLNPQQVQCMKDPDWMLWMPRLTKEYTKRFGRESFGIEATDENLALYTWISHWTIRSDVRTINALLKLFQELSKVDPGFASIFYTPDQAVAAALRANPNEAVLTLHPGQRGYFRLYVPKSFDDLKKNLPPKEEKKFDKKTGKPIKQKSKWQLKPAETYVTTYFVPFPFWLPTDDFAMLTTVIRIMVKERYGKDLWLGFDAVDGAKLPLVPKINEKFASLDDLPSTYDVDAEMKRWELMESPELNPQVRTLVKKLLQRHEKREALWEKWLAKDPAQWKYTAWIEEIKGNTALYYLSRLALWVNPKYVGYQVEKAKEAVREFAQETRTRISKAKAELEGRQWDALDDSFVKRFPMPPLPEKFSGDPRAFCRTRFRKHPYWHRNADVGQDYCGTEDWMKDKPTALEEKAAAVLVDVLQTLLGAKEEEQSVQWLRWMDIPSSTLITFARKLVEWKLEPSDAAPADMNPELLFLGQMIDMMREQRVFPLFDKDKIMELAQERPGAVIMTPHWTRQRCFAFARYDAAQKRTEWNAIDRPNSMQEVRLKVFEQFQGGILASSTAFMQKAYDWIGDDHVVDPLLYSLSPEDFAPAKASMTREWAQKAYMNKLNNLTVADADIMRSILRWELAWPKDPNGVAAQAAAVYRSTKNGTEASDAEQLAVEALCRHPRFIHYLRDKYQKANPLAKQVHQMSRKELCSAWLGKDLDSPILVTDLEGVPFDLTNDKGYFDVHGTTRTGVKEQWLMRHYGITLADLRRYNPEDVLRNLPKANATQLQPQWHALRTYLRQGGSCDLISQETCQHGGIKDLCTWNADGHSCQNHKTEISVIDLLERIVRNLCEVEVPLEPNELVLLVEWERLLRMGFADRNMTLPQMEPGFGGHCKNIQTMWTTWKHEITGSPIVPDVVKKPWKRFMADGRVTGLLAMLGPKWRNLWDSRKLPIQSIPVSSDLMLLKTVVWMLYRLHALQLMDIVVSV